MTWQRIDENTYIDDTLVTCAEYQLFIDEMREQGKYYQPDHWTSYQFSAGQAREPILGVRHSDAIAFCEWLTQREWDKWLYRLPTQQDAKLYPMNIRGTRPIGNWLNEQSQFAWIDSIPKDALALGSSRELPSILNRDIKIPLNIERDINLSRDVGLNIDRVFDRTRVLSRAYDITVALEQINERFYMVYTFAPDLFSDIFILQERIAGRSPAFEGIRLVRERK
jgi:hypothetical protein